MPLPEPAVAALLAALAASRDRFPDVRWLGADTLHVTLLFLGDTDGSRIAPIREAVDATARAFTPFEAATGNGGGRVGHERRGGLGVAWLNLGRGADQVSAIARALSLRLDAGEGWPAKGHAAHVTVARRATRPLVRALELPGAVAPVSWDADRLVLFASHLGPSGPQYEPVHVAALG
jgi:RNA 2',3'-cyclic 3'-phosphodiesterase